MASHDLILLAANLAIRMVMPWPQLATVASSPSPPQVHGQGRERFPALTSPRPH